MGIIYDETMNNNNNNNNNNNDNNNNNPNKHFLLHEIIYISSVLEYIYRRLTSNYIILQQNNIGSPLLSKEETKTTTKVDNNHIGKILNLHCGHNNTYLKNEKDDLWNCIQFIDNHYYSSPNLNLNLNDNIHDNDN